MALKYFYNRYKHAEETEQFSELLPKLTNYFCDKSETAYFIGCGEMCVNGRSIDALLITVNAFVGIEFKNYAEDGDIITVIDNDSQGSWLVYNPDGTPKKDVKGEHLYVKGGQFENPYSQAHSNRQILSKTLKESGIAASVIKDRKAYSGRVPFFVIFTKNLDLEARRTLTPNTKSWFKVTTNSKFIDELDSKLKSYKEPAFTEEEILNFLERWGFNELHDPSEWSRQKYTARGEKKETNVNRKKLETTPVRRNKEFSGSGSSGTSKKPTTIKVDSVEFTYDGRLLTMSCSTQYANIYYTLDGTLPNERTARYSSPFKIGQSKMVKAIAIKKDYEDSDISTFTVPPGNPAVEQIRKYWLWVVVMAVVIAVVLPFARNLDSLQSSVTEPMEQTAGRPSTDLYPMLDGKGWIVKRMDGQVVAVGQVNAEIHTSAAYEDLASTECRLVVVGEYESQFRQITFDYDRHTGQLTSPQLGVGNVEVVNGMIRLRITFEGWIIEK